MGLLQKWMLVLDPAGKQKFEQDMKDTGKKGGKGLSDEVDRGTSPLGGVFKKIGGLLGAAFAVGKIKDFAINSIKAANDAERGWNRVAITLQNNGSSLEEMRGRLERLGDTMLKTTTFGDEAAIESFNTILQITGDLARSEQAVAVAADLAAAKQISLEAASTLVGRAMNGNVTQLQRMGVELRKGDDALVALTEKFGGSAAAELNTFSGKTKQLGQYFGELQEEIGKAMIEAGEGSSIMDTFSGIIAGATEWVVQNKDALILLGKVLLESVAFAFKAVGTVLVSFVEGLKVMAGVAVSGFAVLLKGIAAVDNAAAKMAEFLGFKKAATQLREHAASMQKTIGDLEKFGKEKNKEMELSHTSVGATMKTSIERGASAGSVAMQKMADEAEKATKKFKEQVKQMEYDILREMETSVKDFSDILERTLTELDNHVAASRRKQLADLKQHLLDSKTEYENTNQEIIVNENMTQEQRAQAFRDAAVAGQNAEADRVAEIRRQGEEYNRDAIQQANTRADEERRIVTESGQVEQAVDDATTENAVQNDQTVTTSTQNAAEARVEAINKWGQSLLAVINGVNGIGQAFGALGPHVAGVLNAIQGGVSAVIGTMTALNSAVNTIASNTANLTQKLAAGLQVVAAGAGLGQQIAGLLGGSQQGGAIGGAVGSGLGTLVGGPVGGLIGGALGGIVGGLFKGSKDPERHQRNLDAFNRAKQGDQSALAFLLQKSPTSVGGQGGWATRAMQEEAYRFYQQALAATSGGISQALSSTSTQTSLTNMTGAITQPVIRSSSYPITQSVSPTITIQQYGVTGTNVNQKTLAAVNEGLYKTYQQNATLSGNARMS